MIEVQDGQCGICQHFGETHAASQDLLTIRTEHSAPETFVDDCGHPKHAPLHLKVTATSGCDGFEPTHAN